MHTQKCSLIIIVLFMHIHVIFLSCIHICALQITCVYLPIYMQIATQNTNIHIIFVVSMPQLCPSFLALVPFVSYCNRTRTCLRVSQLLELEGLAAFLVGEGAYSWPIKALLQEQDSEIQPTIFHRLTNKSPLLMIITRTMSYSPLQLFGYSIWQTMVDNKSHQQCIFLILSCVFLILCNLWTRPHYCHISQFKRFTPSFYEIFIVVLHHQLHKFR